MYWIIPNKLLKSKTGGVNQIVASIGRCPMLEAVAPSGQNAQALKGRKHQSDSYREASPYDLKRQFGLLKFTAHLSPISK